MSPRPLSRHLAPGHMAVMRLVACATLSLAASACSGFDHAQLDGVTSMPDDSTLTISSGAMNAGVATAFRPRIWTHNIWGTHEQSDGIDVQTSNASVLRVAHESGDGKRVIVWAASPGTATLQLTLDGEIDQSIDVVVTDPP